MWKKKETWRPRKSPECSVALHFSSLRCTLKVHLTPQVCAPCLRYLQVVQKLIILNPGKSFIRKSWKVDADNSERNNFDPSGKSWPMAAYCLIHGNFLWCWRDATNEKAIQKVFVVKGRNFKTPLHYHQSGRWVYPLVQDVPQTAKRLMAHSGPAHDHSLLASNNCLTAATREAQNRPARLHHPALRE